MESKQKACNYGKCGLGACSNLSQMPMMVLAKPWCVLLMLVSCSWQDSNRLP